MIDINNIFNFKRMNNDKLKSFGFVDCGKHYEIRKTISDNQFYLYVKVSQTDKVYYSVVDSVTNEEYALVKISNAQGPFVGNIRRECEDFLQEISDNCFDIDIFQSEQTKRVVQFIVNKYDSNPEFLWKKYPNYAVFRHQKNNKWFAIIMTIDGKKLNKSLDKKIEIIDLKGIAKNVSSLVDDLNYYKGYHMNKKYWYTAVLDGSISDSELFDKIVDSFQLTQ
ncbi:hypothetical protein D3I35_12435 [Enterococcus faecium]|nr:hypothetical protein [Enterococcus faecium]